VCVCVCVWGGGGCKLALAGVGTFPAPSWSTCPSPRRPSCYACPRSARTVPLNIQARVCILPVLVLGPARCAPCAVLACAVVACAGLRWSVVARGGLWWPVVACGGLWWPVLACGGLWWPVLACCACGGLWWPVVAFGGLRLPVLACDGLCWAVLCAERGQLHQVPHLWRRGHHHECRRRELDRHCHPRYGRMSDQIGLVVVPASVARCAVCRPRCRTLTMCANSLMLFARPCAADDFTTRRRWRREHACGVFRHQLPQRLLCALPRQLRAAVHRHICRCVRAHMQRCCCSCCSCCSCWSFAIGCCWLLLVAVGCCWLLLVAVGCYWLLL
jgi:hypothetical protein